MPPTTNYRSITEENIITENLISKIEIYKVVRSLEPVGSAELVSTQISEFCSTITFTPIAQKERAE